MSEIRESFPSLEDSSTGAGVAAQKSQNGDSSAGKVGMTVWAFKDSSGNIVHPQLNSLGQIPVTTESTGTHKYARGIKSGGSAALTDITGATIALTNSKVYTKISVTVSGFRDTVCQIQWIDNLTTNIIGDINTGSGQYTFTWMQPEMQLTAGATGTQTLKVQGLNQNTLSDIKATISCVEAS
jgi:hypothetical protein